MDSLLLTSSSFKVNTRIKLLGRIPHQSGVPLGELVRDQLKYKKQPADLPNASKNIRTLSRKVLQKLIPLPIKSAILLLTKDRFTTVSAYGRLQSVLK